MRNKVWYLITTIVVIMAVVLISLTGCTPTTGIKGDKGDTGIQGIQGIQGTQGLQGAQGAQGLTGTMGATGISGVGISSVTYSSSTGKLTILLSNGSFYVSEDLRGDDGMNGINGATGATGATGVGISNTIYSSVNGTLKIYFTNGTTYTTGDLRGTQGIQGIQGVAGADGDDGADGVDGQDGITYFENPFTGLAVCHSINNDILGGSDILGHGVFTKIGAAEIQGHVTEEWVHDGYNYQHITGWIIITSIPDGIEYEASIDGWQGYAEPDASDDIFAGTYTFTSGATGSGSITATITDETGSSRILHISVYGILEP